MKQTLKISFLFCAFFICGIYLHADKDIVISVQDLPEKVISYVKTHFPEQEIIKAVKDKDGLSFTYKIKLSGKIELEFTAKGDIKNIDGQNKLPDSVIPEKILNYVKTNYPDNYITGWSIEKRIQEIELDNGIELKFNKKDDFIKIDK